MRVLFVCSGNSKKGINPIVKNQGESLRKEGIELEYFTIRGKGVNGYLKNVPELKRRLKRKKYDIIHAHYSLSALTATLSGFKNLVVSLMGSDIRLNLFFKTAVIASCIFLWKTVIIKSRDMMLKGFRVKNCEIVPNGVNLSEFKPISRETALKITGWDSKKTHFLFGADPERYEKNFSLFEKALEISGLDARVVCHYLKDIPHRNVPQYINSSDLVALTSLWEGSPNVIKEAMACNCPIVTTDVGDVRWVLGTTPGCYVTSFDPKDVASKLEMALEFAEKHGKTNGRERIILLGLDSQQIARKIIEVYENLLR